MQLFAVVFLLVLLEGSSLADDGFPLLNPGGIGGIFKGPHSETIIRGPDGSEITSEEKSGTIVRGDDGGRLEVEPIVVAEDGPIVPDQEALPPLTRAQEPPPVPAAIDVVQQDAHVIETEIVPVPDVEPEQSSDLRGPSGRIVTKGSASIVSGPASATITEPRKIVVAAAKISIPAAPLPLPLPLSFRAVLRQLVPPPPPLPTARVLQYSAPEPTYSSSTVAPSLRSFESSHIDLGAGDVRDSIPVVEYGSANGIFGPSTAAALVSSTPAPEQYASSSSPLPANYRLVPSEAPASSPLPASYQLVSSEVPASSPLPASYRPDLPVDATASASQTLNVQRIPQVGENVEVNGRVDMDYSYYDKPTAQPYQLPHVLGMALSSFYAKRLVKNDNKDRVVIDDKMGELARNEIVYDPKQQFPDLSQAKYIAPALARNGIDASQVNLAPVEYSEVIRLAPDAYHPRQFPQRQLLDRYQRRANNAS